MRNIIALAASLLVSTGAMATSKTISFMPPNNLDKEDSFTAGGGLTQAQFNTVIDNAERIYKPIFQKFGATFKVERLWSDQTVNAYADQLSATDWQVHMYGGLARRAEVTEDGFAMVICHEMGHHLGGYPFVEDWAANEGESDYYATGACAMKMFVPNLELSARAAEIPEAMKAKCQANRPANELDNCYRAVAAGKSLADLLGALESGTVAYDTPDTKEVNKTNNDHPAAQCRLDTYVAGAFCGSATWDYALIPGKELDIHNGLAAQAEAYSHSCEAGDGARPHCWFAPVTVDPAPGGDCPLGDQGLCDLICIFDPSQPYCPGN